MSADAIIRLCLLGGFSAELGETPPAPVRISPRKGRGLLAYLSMQPGHCASREQLADLLWGSRSDAHARQSLRQCLVSLRAELEPHACGLLRIEDESVGLDPQRLSVDALDFAALAGSACDADVQRAAALYSGEFLAGLSIGTEAFDQWIGEERARFASLAMRAFALAAAQLEAAGNGEQAIGMAERLVRLDPFREDAQRMLLRLYAQYRGRDAALAYAGSFTSMLRAELHVEPEPETLGLIDDVRRGAIAGKPSLPASPPLFDTEQGGSAAGAAHERESQKPDEGEKGNRPLFARPIGARAYAVLALAAVLGVWGAWSASDRWSLLQPPGVYVAGASAGAKAQEETQSSWRSPPIFRSAALDRDALAAKGIQALVVLPFSTGVDADDLSRLHADRITDDLINDLSRVSSLRVISRRTSRLYRGQETNIRTIGDELGVHYAVEGTVRVQDSKLRLNVALVDVLTGLQVWSERFERAVSDRFDVQNEIVRGLARRLELGIVMSAADRPIREEADPGTGELLAKGWGVVVRAYSTGSLDGADGHFEAVLRDDPDNVSALVGLAAFHIRRVRLLLVPEREPSLGEAKSLLRRALAINPDSPRAHYFLGVLHRTRGKLEAALHEFATALALNPSLAPAHAQIGHVMNRLGKPDEALRHIDYAIRLSPKDPSLGIWLTFSGIAEVNRGNDEAAVAHLMRALSQMPRNPLGHMALAAVHALKGDMAASAEHVLELKRIMPGHSNEALFEWFIGPGGASTHGLRILQGMRVAFGVSA